MAGLRIQTYVTCKTCLVAFAPADVHSVYFPLLKTLGKPDVRSKQYKINKCRKMHASGLADHPAYSRRGPHASGPVTEAWLSVSRVAAACRLRALTRAIGSQTSSDHDALMHGRGTQLATPQFRPFNSMHESVAAPVELDDHAPWPLPMAAA